MKLRTAPSCGTYLSLAIIIHFLDTTWTTACFKPLISEQNISLYVDRSCGHTSGLYIYVIQGNYRKGRNHPSYGLEGEKFDNN